MSHSIRERCACGHAYVWHQGALHQDAPGKTWCAHARCDCAGFAPGRAVEAGFVSLRALEALAVGVGAVLVLLSGPVLAVLTGSAAICFAVAIPGAAWFAWTGWRRG